MDFSKQNSLSGERFIRGFATWLGHSLSSGLNKQENDRGGGLWEMGGRALAPGQMPGQAQGKSSPPDIAY